jgi:hypothetical protein
MLSKGDSKSVTKVLYCLVQLSIRQTGIARDTNSDARVKRLANGHVPFSTGIGILPKENSTTTNSDTEIRSLGSCTYVRVETRDRETLVNC